MKHLLKSKKWNYQWFVPMLLLILLINCKPVSSQTSEVNPLNQPFNPLTDFLGWEPSVDSDVNIRHLTPGELIRFGTNGVERMRISPNVNRSVLINTTTANNAKLRITQRRGLGAVDGSVVNFDSNNLNRALRVAVAVPFANVNTIIGINTSCTGASNTTDIALLGQAINGRNNYGIYGESSGTGVPGNPLQGNWAGVFSDDVVGTGFSLGSDEALKVNIESLSNAREHILQLRPVSFHFIEHSGINFGEGLQYGFIAQEVQEVIPSLVRPVIVPVSDMGYEPTETLEHLALNQVELIPVMVQALKDHSSEMDESENRIAALQELLDQHFSMNLNNQQDETE